MCEFKIKKVKLGEIEKEWDRLENKNQFITPFQELSLHKIIASHYLFFFFAAREWPCYYSIYKDDKLIMIAPLCKRYSLRGGYYVSFGATPTIAFQDFVYSDEITDHDMKSCIDILLTKCNNHLRLYNIPRNSRLNHVLSKYYTPIRENTNITVPLNGSYDSYYSNLDKHARQNIRTAYNRMKTDGRRWSIECIEGGKLTKEKLKKMMDVYVNRRKTRYRATSFLHEWFLRHYHFNTIALSKLSNSIYLILKIDDEIGAFLAGYTDKNHHYLLIPRLAINEEFGRYSPGVVLINESMKILENDLHLEYLDLSKGNDKYKLIMGGVIYPTFDYSI